MVLQIQLLGDFSVKTGDSPLAALNKPRLQALLGYLILHRDAPQDRHHLAGIFWPDSLEEQALTNLRNLAHLLRRALPGGQALIQATPQTLQWHSPAEVQVDLCRFQGCLAGDIHSAPLETLEAACRLYRGDLLPGCYHAWIENERAGLRRSFGALLAELVGRYEGQRRYAEALDCARRWIELEPLQKDGYLRAMQLAALNGETAQALATYREYARTLARELGTEPEADIQALSVQLAHPRNSPPLQSGPGAPFHPIPLVGRGPEWQALQEGWRSAASGSPRMLILSGEAGIGKSRLAEELLETAARLGVRCAAAHCYASEGALPYAPVVTWLRALGASAQEKDWLPRLARQLPELALLLPELLPEPPAPLKEAWQRLRLFEVLARAALPRQQKTMLMIDDLQWGDQDTLEWLHYLLRFDPHAPLLLVGTLRSEEADANPACAAFLARMRQEGLCLEITLPALDRSETARLAEHVAGRALDQGVSELIYQETEGNPLFIVETVRAELFKQGQPPGVQPLPYKARAVMENRIRQLSPPARELVQQAATIGRAFSIDVLRLASAQPEAALVQDLEELLQRRIVREMAPDRFDFSHARLRDAALAGVSGPRRQLLHRQAGDALVSLSRRGQESQSAEIAGHYEQAGLGGQAVQYYRLAAESARKIFANDLAVRYYQRAAALCEAPPGDPAAMAAPECDLALIREILGDIHTQVGRFPQAQQDFEKALAQGSDQPGLWRARVHRKIAVTLTQPDQFPQAFACLDQAEQALAAGDGMGSLEERQEWIQIQLARSGLVYWGEHPEGMFTILEQIGPLVDADGRPDQQVELLSQQFMARLRAERFRVSAGTVEIARRRLALVETLGVDYDIAWAQFHMGFGLLFSGQPGPARELFRSVYAQAQRMGAELLRVRSLAYISVASRQLGDEEILRELSPLLYELAGQVGETPYQGISRANQGWLAWRAGDLDEAERLCREAREIREKAHWRILTWLADWVLLAAALARGDLAQAEGYARGLLSPDPLAQPILESIAQKLEDALAASQAREEERAFTLFAQALELVKASGDL